MNVEHRWTRAHTIAQVNAIVDSGIASNVCGQAVAAAFLFSGKIASNTTARMAGWVNGVLLSRFKYRVVSYVIKGRKNTHRVEESPLVQEVSHTCTNARSLMALTRTRLPILRRLGVEIV